MMRGLGTRQRTSQRVRAPISMAIDGTGHGLADIYKVPIGHQLEVRRMTFSHSAITDNGSNANALTLPIPSLDLLRSGQHIEWLTPVNFGNTGFAEIPGAQTWGDEEGPLLEGGEVLQLRFFSSAGVIQNQSVYVTMEGNLTKAGSTK